MLQHRAAKAHTGAYHLEQPLLVRDSLPKRKRCDVRRSHPGAHEMWWGANPARHRIARPIQEGSDHMGRPVFGDDYVIVCEEDDVAVRVFHSSIPRVAQSPFRLVYIP